MVIITWIAAFPRLSKELMESPPPVAMTDAKETSALDLELQGHGWESSWLPKSADWSWKQLTFLKLRWLGKDCVQHAEVESQWCSVILRTMGVICLMSVCTENAMGLNQMSERPLWWSTLFFQGPIASLQLLLGPGSFGFPWLSCNAPLSALVCICFLFVSVYCLRDVASHWC